MDEIERLKLAYEKAKLIVYFTGAGVSTKSNIPDFRGKKGIYQMQSEYGVSYETMLSHTYYVNHPETFFDFYKKKMIYLDAIPNKAHTCITDMQNDKNIIVVTQNIDGLHQKAGNDNVIELHGSIHRNYCEKCHKFYTAEDIMKQKGVPYCDCGGRIKPDVVLYEEGLDEANINNALTAISQADLIIVAGTSLNVYPAASFIRYRKPLSTLAIINFEVTPYDDYADIVIHDDIGNTLEKLR